MEERKTGREIAKNTMISFKEFCDLYMLIETEKEAFAKFLGFEQESTEKSSVSQWFNKFNEFCNKENF